MLEVNNQWLCLLDYLVKYGNAVCPRGQPCREILCYRTKIPMVQPVVTIKERKLGRRFMAAEAWWILSGRNDLASIAPYSKEIHKFSNDGQRFDGAYGPKVVDQVRHAVYSLAMDRDTRQAVITMWRENPRPSLDVPCTISCQFLIRDGLLHCVDTMRSSDAWLGIVYDWFNFSMLSALILLELRLIDPKAFNDVELGTLTLVAGSQHLYERNLDDARRALDPSTMEEDDYAPLNLAEFRSPGGLVEHLGLLKDRRHTDSRWLRELIPVKETTNTSNTYAFEPGKPNAYVIEGKVDE